MSQQIGRYVVQSELGRGGFGRVFRAYDPTVGRNVAIKTLTSDGDPDMLVRFRNEAAAAGKLHHKNIVTIFDFGENNNEPYIVMELLEGEDIQRILKNDRRIPFVQKMNIMNQVAEGLQHAHSYGVVHRDVKPANIMVLPDSSVKIMDFGIALLTQAATRLTKTGLIPGTLRYMSPEQFRGANNDPMSDIFAFGITYYELLTGVHPFDAPSPPAIMYKIVNVDPEPIRQRCPECPEALDHAIMRCLHKDREMRFPNFADLQLDLRPIMVEAQRLRAQNLLLEARSQLNDQNLDQVNTLLREILELDPSNSEARAMRRTLQIETERQMVRPKIEELINTGRMKLGTGNYQDALQSFESALRFDRTNSELKSLIETARGQMRRSEEAKKYVGEARRDLDTGNLTGAIQTLNRALELDPTNSDAGQILEEARRHMAVREQHRMLEEGLSKARGAVLLQAHEEAIRILEQLQPRYPGNEQISELLHKIQGELFEKQSKEKLSEHLDSIRYTIRQGHIEEGVTKLVDLAKQFPDSTELKSLHSFANAELQSRQRRAQIDAARTEAHRYKEAGNFDEALRSIKAAMAKFPEEKAFADDLQSVLDAKRADALHAAKRDAIDGANALCRDRRYGDAIRKLDAFSESFGQDAEVSALRKQLDERWNVHKKTEAAESQIQQAKRLLERNNPSEAERLLRLALSSVPDHPEATTLLDQAQHALAGRHRENEIFRILSEANQYSATRAYDKAVEALDQGLRNYPNEPSLIEARQAALNSKSSLQRDQARMEALHKIRQARGDNRIDDALSMADSALHSFPGDETIATLKRQLLKEKERQSLVSSIRTEWRAGRVPEAQQQLEAALQVFPNDAELVDLRTQIDADMERATRQERVWKLVARSRELIEAKDFERALTLLDRGLGYYPNDTDLIVARDLVITSKSSHDRQSALKQALTAIEEAHRQERFVDGLELINAARGQFGDEAGLLDWKRRMETDQQQRQRQQEVRNAVSEARAKNASNDPEGALRLLDGVLKRYPEESTIQALRAEVHEQVYRKKKQRLLSQVESLTADKRFGDALQAVAGVQREIGQDSEIKSLRERLETEKRSHEEQQLRKRTIDQIQLIAEEVDGVSEKKKLKELIKQLERVAAPQISDKEVASHVAAVREKINQKLAPAPAQPVRRGPGAAEVPTGPKKSPNWVLIVGVAAAIGVGIAFIPKFMSGPSTTPPVPTETTNTTPSPTPGTDTGTKTQPKATEAPIASYPPPSPPPSIPQGSVLIATGVEGAYVYIDNKSYGRTDTQGNLKFKLEAKTYAVRIDKPGYTGENQRKIKVFKDKEQEVRFTLTPAEATLQIQGGTAGATLRHLPDGKVLGSIGGDGTISLRIAPGEHTFEVGKDQFTPKQVSRRINPGETVQLTARDVALTPLPKVDPNAGISQEFEKARAAQTAAAMEDFLRKRPDSPFTASAQQILDDLQWNPVNKKDVAALREFEKKFSRNRHAKEASQRAGQLEDEANKLKQEQAAQQAALQAQLKAQADAASRALDNAKAAEQQSMDRKAIYDALGRYAAAFNNKDAAALQAAFPDIPSKTLDDWKRVFSDKSVRITMSLQPIADPEIRGNTATLDCQQSTVTIARNSNSGNKVPPVRKMRVTLIKQNQNWVIQHVINAN